MGNTTGTGASAPVTPSTPQTIEGVTVTVPTEKGGWCDLHFATGERLTLTEDKVRAMGLVVPEPVVECRIGTAEFTLTRVAANPETPRLADLPPGSILWCPSTDSLRVVQPNGSVVDTSGHSACHQPYVDQNLRDGIYTVVHVAERVR